MPFEGGGVDRERVGPVGLVDAMKRDDDGGVAQQECIQIGCEQAATEQPLY
ncbi:hypothetical protein D3C83_138330 [compost metagenome]